MTTNERQQRMAERILEDENLRGDLEDDAAAALVDWASAQAAEAAADPARTDASVEAHVQAIRQAAREAALSGETAPQQLIALAVARLAPSQDAAQVERPAVVAGVSATENAAASASVPAVGATSVVAAIPTAPPTPSALPTELVGGGASEPAKPVGNRTRRKRSRLARFFKYLLGRH